MDPAALLQSEFEKIRPKSHLNRLAALLTDPFMAISRAFDLTKMQESWSWRNTHLARELALLLIDERGELNRALLKEAADVLQANLYSLGPGGSSDALSRHHALNTLQLFLAKKEYETALKKIFRPLGYAVADKLIRETLQLPEGAPLTDAHARQATLAALLTMLRQNVGSCFATAPAILIQQELPLNFLTDVRDLFGSGRVTRTFEGQEYVAPLSLSWGVGDLFRPFLLSQLGNDPLEVLSYSPGLQLALEQSRLIEKGAEPEKKRERAHLLIQGAFKRGIDFNPFGVITPFQILKNILLTAFGVTEEDVKNFRSRNLQGPHIELIIQAPVVESGKALACSRFIKAFEEAKSAFKALTDNALLKAWEFTLASLSEAKADFAKWNLYTSLGVQADEPYGIGATLQEELQRRIQVINEEIQDLQNRYEHLFVQMKYLEGRLSRASTESEINWVQADYRMRSHEIRRVLAERDSLYDKGKKLQSLYPLLIKFYGEKIKEYFQEVYDAEMHESSPNPYDDSPAGFRLMYKHGRSNPALWSPIFSAAEYIQYLVSFFGSTEIELNQKPELEGLEREISSLITAMVQTIKRPEFLKYSIVRLAKFYQEPISEEALENFDTLGRKPWSYVSGGAMSTLVSCYWNNPDKPKEVKRWVENENELLAFLIDCMKEMPQKLQNHFQNQTEASLLAFSPTHAFLCKPGWELFRKGWESDIYTYTWIRDHWLLGQKKFLDSLLLTHRMMDLLVEKLLLFMPINYRPLVKESLKSFTHEMTPPEFRDHVLRVLSYQKWLQSSQNKNLVAEELDSLLFCSLPLFPDHTLRDNLTLLIENLDMDSSLKKALFQRFDKVEIDFEKYHILSAKDLRNITKGLLIGVLNSAYSSVFYDKLIVEAMQKTSLSFPAPLLFADTNWVNNVFGFTLNPGTRLLELWRLDPLGADGRPLSQWKSYLNGQDPREWGLYINPAEYH